MDEGRPKVGIGVTKYSIYNEIKQITKLKVYHNQVYKGRGSLKPTQDIKFCKSFAENPQPDSKHDGFGLELGKK